MDIENSILNEQKHYKEPNKNYFLKQSFRYIIVPAIVGVLVSGPILAIPTILKVSGNDLFVNSDAILSKIGASIATVIMTVISILFAKFYHKQTYSDLRGYDKSSKYMLFVYMMSSSIGSLLLSINNIVRNGTTPQFNIDGITYLKSQGFGAISGLIIYAINVVMLAKVFKLFYDVANSYEDSQKNLPKVLLTLWSIGTVAFLINQFVFVAGIDAVHFIGNILGRIICLVPIVILSNIMKDKEKLDNELYLKTIPIAYIVIELIRGIALLVIPSK